jgi:peptidoglycan hydrolase-like protein with peptidoglycan-binding domain
LTTLYPYGYGTTMLSMPQMMVRKTVNLLLPEFRRRVFALMEEAAEEGIPLGIGTGWRIQPDPPPPGFARPGNSNHESFPAGSGTATAVAADMVPQAAWPWMNRNCATFGLRHFATVNNEPWHIQPLEIPAGRNWRKEPWDLEPFPLPVKEKPPTGVTITVEVTRQILKPNANAQSGYDVFVLQSILNGIYAGSLTLDGMYGIRTIAAVQEAQRTLGLAVDGICGPKTWARLENG